MAGSLESALAEEAREVMALLEGRSLKQPEAPRAQRAKSPGGVAQSPVRSMLDIAGPPVSRTGRHSSIAGTSLSGVSRPSMLNDAAAPQSAVARNTALNQRPASRSPAPPARMTPYKPGLEDLHKFDVLPANEANSLPKRVSQGGKLGKANSVFNRDPSGGGERRPRHGSFLSGKGKSISPGGGRSKSPGLNTNSMNLMPTPGKFVSDSGQLIDMNSAYRRLSDAALLKSGSNLANLPFRKELNTETGEEMAPDGGVRLTKDYTHPGEQLVDTSDEEALSSDDEYSYDLEKRGRVRARKGSNEPSEKADIPSRQPKSLLWAVEEERKDTAAKQVYRSLLEPEVTVTGPDGAKSDKSGNRRGIHPSTSFDNHSEISTPYDTDREEVLTDIHRAQKMQVSISPIHSTPSAQRSIRQIIRGDFENLQKEAEQGLRRQRMYLVATDLSDEAAYALEWTIGTVLRDGDTLLAVYAVDEELGTGIEHPTTETAHGADVVKDLGAITRTLSHEAHVNNTLTIPGNAPDADTNGNSPTSPSFPPGARHSSTTTEQDIARMDKGEKERYHAVQEVTDRCVKLLRKTKLQVRVVVEVFHCKSPKHMITEVIDFLTPTLVVLGSRGRSALKGVLLGSFSNYLVTKSSVPVMVARKKLRKHSKSGAFRGGMRLSNMLAGVSEGKFSRLETAKIEKPMALRLTGSA